MINLNNMQKPRIYIMYVTIFCSLTMVALSIMIASAQTTYPSTNVSPTPSPTPVASSYSFQYAVLPSSSYTAMYDAQLNQNSPATNYGSQATVTVDGSEGSTTHDVEVLMKWDTSLVPTTCRVTSATIQLSVSNSTVDTYELYQVKRAWNETQANWNLAASGVLWQTAGAFGTGDVDSVVLGQTTSFNATGNKIITLNTSGITVVQAWVKRTVANNGFMLRDSSAPDGLIFNSKENFSSNTRPKLTIHCMYHDPFKRGDANLDQRVDISDIVTIAKTQNQLRPVYKSGNPTLVANCQKAADPDDNGRIDINDAFYLISFLFGGGSKPPAPGPDTTGFDPTADSLTCTRYP